MSLLTVDEAAAELRVHPATIRRMIKRGDIAAVRIGKVWRVDASIVTPVVATVEAVPVEEHSAAYYVQLAQHHSSALASPTPPPDTGARNDQAGWSH